MSFMFGDCVLDPDRRELSRGSEVIATGPQVFDLLVYLVENRERVVSRDDLLKAVWHGRIVSESTLASHINAARKAIGDSGQAQRLIRTVARKGFRFVGEVRETKPSGDAASGDAASMGRAPAAPEEVTAEPPALPDRPSIAILPFANLSGDPAQDYFADGVVEDIISALSRIRWLFVIARNSSFTYKGHAVDVKQVGRTLGVRYVLEGSLRKAEKRVRITGQLIDATTGGHIWGDRFEGMLGDIFELQDQVTVNVVGAIARQLEQAEIERARRKPTESLDAYDYYLRGMAGLHLWTREGSEEALLHFYRAIELDPSFASAYGMAARCFTQRKSSGWMTDRQQEVTETVRLARQARDLGREDAVALSGAGFALAYVAGEVDEGATLIQRALVLNPNLAWAWYFSGWVKIYLGEPETAIQHATQAMRLSPNDTHLFNMQAVAAYGHLYAGRFNEAVS